MPPVDTQTPAQHPAAAIPGARHIPGCAVTVRRCVKCGLPETYETIEFDAHGVCNVCRQKEHRDTAIDWAARKQMLNQLVEEYRGKTAYDVIVPFSGGKDSTWTLYYLMKEYNLKPLVVQFDHGFMRPGLRENNERTFRKLGVEVHSFRPNWRVVKRVMLEALIRKGDFCWHCHTGIFAYPMWVALKEQTPLVMWGEPSSEYTAYYDYRDDEVEEVDETRFNRFVNLGITAEDMAGMIRDGFDFDERDLKPFTYPPMRELKRLRYRSLCLGSFIPWDVKTQSAVIQTELGWQGDQVEGMPQGMYTYEKIECWMQGVRDYIKFLKRGYSRVTQMTALDLRNGRMDKAAADRIVEEYEGRRPPSLELFLEYLGLSEDEFNAIVMKTVVPPHRPDFAAIRNADKTPDFDHWYREGSVAQSPV
ncbi:MAG: N-acetyl sugar amidotransferase [Planctomycetota bacterium]|nr:MAG: N-acetyl sugar amidotransferase [Planctomycetota bacterium]